MASLNSQPTAPGAQRTADLARRAGYSVQQIRNLERVGVLPPATRTPAGYRQYGEVHALSVLAYKALAAAVGPVQARSVLHTLHTRPRARLLALLDATHAQLHREREDVELALHLAARISAEPVHDVRPLDAMSISELAAALGVRPSTLRHWDHEALVVPDRITPRGPRSYSPAQVAEARIVHQLRKAGYPVPAVRKLLPTLRQAVGLPQVQEALARRTSVLTERSAALLQASAHIDALLSARGQSSG